MDWYYAEGNEQRGPVTEADWEQLVASGAIKPETLVWREGMAAWQPYGVVSGGSGAASGQGGLVCAQCGRAFPPEQVMRYGEQWVCAGCKPLLLQRVREGAGAAPSSGQLTEEQLLARDYQVDVGAYFRAGWESFTSDPWPQVGVMLLLMLAYFAVSAIPYLSLILAMIFGGPLIGGTWNYFIKRQRGEVVTVEDAFKGFGPRFGQLVWTNVVWTLATWLAMSPMFAMLLAGGFMTGQGGRNLEAVGMGLIVLGVFLAVIAIVAAIYLSAVWFFAFPLVMDKGMRFWPAMQLSRRVVSKRFWGTLLLFFVLWLLYVGGFLLCCVGVLAALPVMMGMLAQHYQRVFGDLRSQA